MKVIDIPDPFGGSWDDYHDAFDAIRKEVRPLLKDYVKTLRF